VRQSILVLSLLMLLTAGCAVNQEVEITPTPTTFQPFPATSTPDQPASAKALQEPTPTKPPAGIPGTASLAWVEVAREFNRPVFLTYAGDRRIFVLEQRGMIWILENGQRLPEPFLVSGTG